MANPRHIATLKLGIKSWNKWRKNNPAIIPDLRGGDLSKVDLSGADLHGALINEITLLRTRKIKGSAQIGVNGIWSKQ